VWVVRLASSSAYWDQFIMKIKSRIKDPRVEQLVPTHPDVHSRNTYSRIRSSEVLVLHDEVVDVFLQIDAGEGGLRLIWTHDARSYGSTQHCFGVVEQEEVTRFSLA